MSKKKPTAPIPLTGTVTITTDGRTTLAMKASHRGEDIEVRTGLSHCRPGDVYSEYEGARIALARLYGLDPFPNAEDTAQEKGHWEKATEENFKVGSRVRVVAPYLSGGKYREGDQGVVKRAPNPGEMAGGVQFNWSGKATQAACFLRELEVWVPDTQEKGHWEKATMENAKVGSRVRVVAAMLSDGAYRNGDQGILQDAPPEGALRHILFDGRKTPSVPGCWLRELEVWVPDAPEDAWPYRENEPKGAPGAEGTHLFTPSFQVGDIVRLTETADLFHPSCRGKVGKVIWVSEPPVLPGATYFLAVNLNPGETRHQYCMEWPDDPAPLELLFRDPQKGGEKA